jgi:hypothetical protein
MKHHSFMHLRPSTFENRRGPPFFFPTKSQASSKQYRQYYPHNIQQLNGWNHGQATKWSRTESLGMIPDQCAGPHPSACAGSGVAPSKAVLVSCVPRPGHPLSDQGEKHLAIVGCWRLVYVFASEQGNGGAFQAVSISYGVILSNLTHCSFKAWHKRQVYFHN